MPHISALFTMFVWGLTFVCTKVLLEYLSPIDILIARTVLGVLALAGCFVTWGYSVKHLGPTAASAYIYLQAPITVVTAVLILGEPMTVLIALGIGLVIAGLVLSEGYGGKAEVS